MPGMQHISRDRDASPVVDSAVGGAKTGVQARSGNAAAQDALARKSGAPATEADASLDDRMPEALDLNKAGVSFRLPADTALTGNWNQVTTQDATRVWMSVSDKELRVQFWPALLVDAQWPLSNVAWEGLSWDFNAGKLTNVSLRNTQWAVPISGFVRDAIADFVRNLTSGTPLGRQGYTPFADEDLVGTLAGLQSNFQAAGKKAGGKGGALAPEDVDGVSLSAGFQARTNIAEGTDDGGINVQKGSTLDVSVDVSGNMKDLASGTVPDVTGIDIRGDAIVLRRDGKDVARLQHVEIGTGGVVQVRRFEGLGGLEKAQGVEAGLKGLALLFQLAALRSGQSPGGQLVRPDHDVVDGVAMKQMNTALTKAVQQLVRDHHDAVPGVDLRRVLGVAPETKPGGGGEPNS